VTAPKARWWNDGRAALVGALLMVLGNATAHMLMLPPYQAVDEGRHMGYAVALTTGHIPHVLDPIEPKDLALPDIKGTNIQAAAAHPPLYHSIVGFPVKLASQAGSAAVAVRIARSISIVFGLLSVAMMYRLLRTLLPGRRDLVAMALGAVACLPIFTFAISVAYNDALAMLGVTGVLATTAAAAVGGFRRRLYIECAIWMSVAGLTRMTAFLATVPAALVWIWIARDIGLGKRLRPLLRGLLAGAGLFTAAALTSGWFYIRSFVMYGDPTAATALLGHLKRVPHGYFRAFVERPAVLFEQHWTRIVGGVFLPASSERYAHALAILTVIGIVVLGVRMVRRRPLALPDLATRWAWVAVLGAAAVNLGLVLAFHAKGGDITPRYILAFFWLQMLVLVVTMTWPRGPYLAAGVLFSMALMHFLIMEAYASEQVGNVLLAQEEGRRRGSDFAVAVGIRRSGVPEPEVWFVGWLALFTAGFTMIIREAFRHYRPTLASDVALAGPGAVGGEGGRLDLPGDEADHRERDVHDEEHEQPERDALRGGEADGREHHRKERLADADAAHADRQEPHQVGDGQQAHRVEERDRDA